MLTVVTAAAAVASLLLPAAQQMPDVVPVYHQFVSTTSNLINFKNATFKQPVDLRCLCVMPHSISLH
jgi:hypothetical protein